MAKRKKCSHCGSAKIPFEIDEEILYSLLTGIIYLLIVLIKWVIGLVILVLYDWWRAVYHFILRGITHSSSRYKWKCRSWFLGNE